MKVSIDIDLATLGFEQDSDGEYYPTGDLAGSVAHIIADKISARLVRNAIEDQVRIIVDERVRKLVDETLSGPIRQTDGWGNPKGETTTVAALVMQAVEKWLQAPKADSNSFNRRQTMTECLDVFVREQMVNALKPTVDEAKKRVNAQVLQLAVDGAAEALAKARVL